MATNRTLPLREAIVTALKADSGLTSIVAPAQVNGERAEANPIFPFTRYGVSEARPRSTDVPIHAFSKAEFTDEVAGINAAIVAALDGRTLALGDGERAYLTWTGSTIMPDSAEAGVYHGINRFTITTPDC